MQINRPLRQAAVKVLHCTANSKFWNTFCSNEAKNEASDSFSIHSTPYQINNLNQAKRWLGQCRPKHCVWEPDHLFQECRKSQFQMDCAFWKLWSQKTHSGIRMLYFNEFELELPHPLHKLTRSHIWATNPPSKHLLTSPNLGRTENKPSRVWIQNSLSDRVSCYSNSSQIKTSKVENFQLVHMLNPTLGLVMWVTQLSILTRIIWRMEKTPRWNTINSSDYSHQSSVSTLQKDAADIYTTNKKIG